MLSSLVFHDEAWASRAALVALYPSQWPSLFRACLNLFLEPGPKVDGGKCSFGPKVPGSRPATHDQQHDCVVIGSWLKRFWGPPFKGPLVHLILQLALWRHGKGTAPGGASEVVEANWVVAVVVWLWGRVVLPQCVDLQGLAHQPADLPAELGHCFQNYASLVCIMCSKFLERLQCFSLL